MSSGRRPWCVAAGASVLELLVPVEVVGPTLVQKIGRKRPLRRDEILRSRLRRRPKRPHGERAALAPVAALAGRYDVRPRGQPSFRARDDVLEGQLGGSELPAAILALKAVA